MPKPDPALLDHRRYRFCCSIETRFSDLDVNRHVNNVALLGMIEEGRVRYHRETGLFVSLTGTLPMVASLRAEFIGQSYFPDPLDIRVAVAHLGRTSYTLYQLVSQGERICAFAETVMVCMDQHGPVALPANVREIGAMWTLLPPPA